MPIFQRTTKTIQHADDGPGVLGAGEDTESLTWNNGTGHFTTSAGGGGGVTPLTAPTDVVARGSWYAENYISWSYTGDPVDG